MSQRNATGCVAVFLLLLGGCGGREHAINVAASAPGQKVNVEMTARSFAFDPDVITAQKGETLILSVTNVSGEMHNIIVKNPSGDVVADKDIPRHQTVTVEIPLPTAGVYPFYCDIDLHAALGMKGRIEVR